MINEGAWLDAGMQEMAATRIDGHADVGVVFRLMDRESRKEVELQRRGAGHTYGHLEFLRLGCMIGSSSFMLA